MPALVLETIGADGDFPTLADWAAALPADLTASDEIRVAELGMSSVDPGGAVISCVCDGSRYVVIRAQAGASVADQADPEIDPLRVDPGLGALIQATSGPAVSLAGLATRVELHGLQIASDAGGALFDGSTGSRFHRIVGCIIEGNSSSPAIALTGIGAEVRSSVILQNGTGNGVELTDGASMTGTTVFKQSKPLADGVGVSSSGTPAASIASVAVAGFAESFDITGASASNLASDQINRLTAPDDLNDPSWSRISASIDPADTTVGPNGIPLQRVGNNLNGFSYFSAGNLHSLQPGERFSFSIIVSDVTALISALLFDASPNRPEMRVDWQTPTPTVTILGATASFQTISGTVTDLGNGAWRMSLVAQNDTASAIDVTPIFYVTRDVANVGLDVGMYAGSVMAGNGHLGTGFTYAGSVPGANPVEGFDPALAFQNDTAALLDLRPVAGGALDTASGSISQGVDLYGRHRSSPETIGAVALNTEAAAGPADLAISTMLDAAHALDEAEILSAFRSRTLLPASPVRVINV